MTISGQNFSSPVSVVFTHSESFSAGIQSVTSTSVTVLTPAIPNSELETEACDDNGDGTEGERYIATSFDITVTNLETEGEATFENAYTYTPTNPPCRNDEAGTLPQCSNGVDDDGDTLVDFPNDPQCANADDNNEAM